VPGWRLAIGIVVVFSVSVGLAILCFVQEPNDVAALAEKRKEQGFLRVFRINLPKVWQLFKYPTFVLILCQGAPGTVPWTVFPFFTQWLELSCFTHGQTALILSAFGWGCAFSSLVSGCLLNFVARRFPDRGPPSIANFSVAAGIPFLFFFFYVLPKPRALGDGGGQVPVFFTTFLFFGLGASMCGTVNKKVYADIVPPHIFTYVFAVDNLIESGVGNFAGLAVGVVTDRVFNYDQNATESGECAPDEAQKLGKGMFLVCNVAWAICFTVYLGMHWTYPKDRKAQLLLRREEAERKQRERNNKDVDIGAAISETQLAETFFYPDTS